MVPKEKKEMVMQNQSVTKSHSPGKLQSTETVKKIVVPKTGNQNTFRCRASFLSTEKILH